jgi:hypothetical protein
MQQRHSRRRLYLISPEKSPLRLLRPSLSPRICRGGVYPAFLGSSFRFSLFAFRFCTHHYA